MRTVVTLTIIFYYIDLFSRINETSLSIHEQVMLFLIPAGIAMIGIVNTGKITINNFNIHVQYRMFFLKIEMLKRLEDYKISFKDIKSMYNLFPMWFPIKFVVIEYRNESLGRTLAIANVIQNWRGGLAKILQNVDNSLIHEDLKNWKK